MIKIIRDPEALEDLTPEELGKIFAEMPSDQQARVFNALAETAATWPRNSQVQWVYVSEEMTRAAVDVLDDIVQFYRGLE